MPPSPSEAADWAVDTTDQENQRRGVTLLGTAIFGSDEVYLQLFRLYVQESEDPLVRAAAISALARHGTALDAKLIAVNLDSQFVQVRLAAAIGLQRLHDPEVAEAMYQKLVDENESADIRVELAIGLGQYPRDDVFQALVTALDQTELTVNYAAMDSLRILTDQDFGIARTRWITWYETTPLERRFAANSLYLYPTFVRPYGFWDYVVFWDMPVWEKPGLPAGLAATGQRSTYEADDASHSGSESR